MSEKKSGSSCLVLFFKSWVISCLVFGLGLASVVGLGIRFGGWSTEVWSQWGWTSYPVMAIGSVVLCSMALAFMLSAFLAVAKAFLNRDTSRSSSRSSSFRSSGRPQSRRKTTV